jgi:hypothetical protein
MRTEEKRGRKKEMEIKREGEKGRERKSEQERGFVRGQFININRICEKRRGGEGC